VSDRPTCFSQILSSRNRLILRWDVGESEVDGSVVIKRPLKGLGLLSSVKPLEHSLIQRPDQCDKISYMCSLSVEEEIK